MTTKEAIKSLRSEYCGNKAFCELYRVSLCRTTDCEIYHAIKALEQLSANGSQIKESSDSKAFGESTGENTNASQVKIINDGTYRGGEE